MVHGQADAWRILGERIVLGERYVWFHAASLGEFEQGRPVIERIKAEQPDVKVVLTFFSPSGYEVRKGYDGADVVVYLPFATRKNARRFVQLVQPEKVVFIKYEFWANYLEVLHEQGVPTYIIAAIFNERQAFFKWWGRSYRKCLSLFTHLFVQDVASAELLAQYGVQCTTVCGDPRFDRMKAVAQAAKRVDEIERFVGTVPVVIAGSSWGPDEELLVRYWRERGGFKLILVPHEIHEEHLQAIDQLAEGQALRFTQLRAGTDVVLENKVLVVDTMGMLSSMYRYATVAYVGGGFGRGIHNTVEAAVYGVPVVWGPKYAKFREAHGLIACEGGFSVSTYEELEELMDRLLPNAVIYGECAAQYVAAEVGATDVIYKELFG